MNNRMCGAFVAQTDFFILIFFFLYRICRNFRTMLESDELMHRGDEFIPIITYTYKHVHKHIIMCVYFLSGARKIKLAR